MTTFDTFTQMWSRSLAEAPQRWAEFVNKTANLPKVAAIARKVRVGATHARAVYREDKLRLLQYATGARPRYATPTVFVFALVNRPYILDLREGKSVVRHFIDAGFDTYNVDWGVPSDGDRFLSMEDYVDRYMNNIVDTVRDRCNVDRVNLIGYCMGGSMSAMYTALHPDKIRNLILMAAPVDWSDRSALLALWSDPRYFDVDQFIEVFGNAPAEWLQSSFLLLKPVSNLVEKYVTFYENMEDEKFLEDFFAMETWLNDNIPVAGEMFRQFVKYCIQENRLIKGELEIGGRRVDLQRVTCPVMNLVAQHDHLVPCGQSLPFNAAIGSKDAQAIEFPAGHIGLSVGSRAHRDLWPKVVSWLGERSDAG
ncbi:MAG: class III poly(R)-hydroxyalkanoic acid synthase subunit PhaC [Phycisphaerales bacterium]|nr:MAG: class III poly(R)-hydroxyalkanoic acid synthase subunit PhaC [Phycisphaerales bacterium]